nr:MAG TPA: hypothetical protein [Caudoviricetes sp.]
MPRGSFFIFGKNFYKFRKRRGALIYGASRPFFISPLRREAGREKRVFAVESRRRQQSGPAKRGQGGGRSCP